MIYVFKLISKSHCISFFLIKQQGKSVGIQEGVNVCVYFGDCGYVELSVCVCFGECICDWLCA